VAGRLNALPVGYTARILLWNAATWQRAGLALPRTWDELFAAGPVFRRTLGEAFYPLDGELYDMLLLAQAHVQQQHGVAYLDPAEPRVAMSRAQAQEWVRLYRRLVDSHVCTSLRLRASLGGAEKPTEQQQDWVLGRWAGNYTWDSVIGLRASTLPKEQPLALGEFPLVPGARNSGLFGRPTLMYTVSRRAPQSATAEAAARLVGFLLGDPEAASILGRTRGAPSARDALATVLRENKLPPLERAARDQIARARAAGAIPAPSPLFEHARMQKFMREVFERVAYGKLADDEAAAHLVDHGNAMLRRLVPPAAPPPRTT
jgi:oligogalacturonide transport system substrate-binding protein